jgi:hypothetical protein
VPGQTLGSPVDSQDRGRRKHVRKLTLVFAFFALSLLAPLAQAKEKPLIDRASVAGDTFVNPCTGEVVTLTSGTFQVVLHEFVDNGDGFHGIAEGNAMGVRGVGSAGNTYRAGGGFWFEFNSHEPQVAFTGVDVLNLASKGSADNFVVVATVHLTVTPDGELVVFFEEERAECRG